jgi:hypothetical protein
MTDKPKLQTSAVSLVRGRVRDSIARQTQARDEVGTLLTPDFFENAPFDQVGVMFRYGERTHLEPEYQRIVRVGSVRELPIAVELDMEVLRRAKAEEVYAIFKQALLDALLAIAAKYGLPAERLQEERHRTPTVIENSATPPQTEPEPDPGGVVKLYKSSAEGMQFWETWEDDDQIVTHWGAVGDSGEATMLPKNAVSRRKVRADVARKRTEGYSEIDPEDHTSIMVQYRVEGWATPADLERRDAVAELLDEWLGWTGLGHCDTRDAGSGTMNLFCEVVDGPLAIEVIRGGLEEKGYLEGAILAVEDETGFQVYWPPEFHGEVQAAAP